MDHNGVTWSDDVSKNVSTNGPVKWRKLANVVQIASNCEVLQLDDFDGISGINMK